MNLKPWHQVLRGDSVTLRGEDRQTARGILLSFLFWIQLLIVDTIGVACLGTFWFIHTYYHYTTRNRHHGSKLEGANTSLRRSWSRRYG